MNQYCYPDFPRPLHGQHGASPPRLAARVAGDGDDHPGSRGFEAMGVDA